MQIFIIGVSGAGKDTQAKLISKEYDLHWLSIGQILRDRSNVGDELGIDIKYKIDKGELVEWDMLKEVVKDELELYPSNFVWTGFPRLVKQALECDNMLINSPFQINLVINLRIPDEASQDRIIKRLQTSTLVREDDRKFEAIQKRIETYKRSIGDIRTYYQGTNRFIDIDGMQTIPEVFESIKKELISRQLV